MKISTKFISASAVLVGAIALISGGGTLWRNSAERNSLDKYTRAQQSIQLIKQIENRIYEDILNQKDQVLLNEYNLEFEEHDKKFNELLNQLVALVKTPEVEAIRQRHEIFERLKAQIHQSANQTSPTSLADNQQDFRAINSFGRDINFFLQRLQQQAQQQAEEAEQELIQVQMIANVLSYSSVALLILLVFGKFWWILRPIIQSLHTLQQGANEVGAGNLNYRLNIHTGDEIEELADAFNQMGGKLEDSRLTIERANADLEQRVSDRTLELKNALSELQRTQSQVVQSEKMSSLGQLVAGVAHEINNPVNFIHGNLVHVQEHAKDLLNFLHLYQHHFPHPGPEIEAEAEALDLEFIQNDLPKTLTSMQVGTERIRQIVLSLRNFSRMDEAEVKPVDIHEGIDSTLLILQHRLKATAQRPEIEVVKDYGQLPSVECYAGQLNQVFMNILTNAIDALEESNTNQTYQEIQKHPNRITIRTSVIGDQWVEIAIIDNGPGMPKAVQEQIFNPFFTTKPLGKGTGMGMSISYQIITDKHNGKLECISTPKQGTKFMIQVPIHLNINTAKKLNSGRELPT